MNRRGFLTSLAALAAGLVLDEVTGLWGPRKKVWQVGTKLEGSYCLDLETTVNGRSIIRAVDPQGKLTDHSWPERPLEYSPRDASMVANFYYSYGLTPQIWSRDILVSKVSI